MVGEAGGGGAASKPPRPEQLLAIIRERAERSDRVVLTFHALERMEQRDITAVDVFGILRRGRIAGSIGRGKEPGDWVCKLVDRIKGTREAGVVTAVVRSGRLVIVTVEWEDRR